MVPRDTYLKKGNKRHPVGLYWALTRVRTPSKKVDISPFQGATFYLVFQYMPMKIMGYVENIFCAKLHNLHLLTSCTSSRSLFLLVGLCLPNSNPKLLHLLGLINTNPLQNASNFTLLHLSPPHF